MLASRIIRKMDKTKKIEYIFYKYDSFDEIKNIIIEKLPLIGGGEEWGYSFEESKAIYRDFLKSKKRSTKIGSIAELLVHIFLNEIGFKQHCLFFNLEENSIKKGFDGVYENPLGIWFVESKSSEQNSISHDEKIVEAMNDLKCKFSGDVTNDPWRNAFNHAKSFHINRHTTLLNKLNELSKMFINKKKINIENYNLMPCSTLFYDNDISIDDVIEAIDMKLSSYKYNELIVLCFNNNIIKEIIAFFEVDL